MLLAAACGGSSAPASTRVGGALVAALEAADDARVPWRCAAPDGPDLTEEVVGAWKLTGHGMRRAAGGTITIGVIADAGGAAPATIAALGRLRPKLEDVDLLLVLGGMGTTRGELEATLGTIANDASWPTVVLPGDLESVGALGEAIATLRAKGLLVVDGRLAQRIELPNVLIATVAGASDASRLVAGADGCEYHAEHVAAALADLTAFAGIRILAAAEAPRTASTLEALRAGLGATDAGERALVPGATQEIDVSLHGPVDVEASPARTGGRDGAAVPLTPGTSDASIRLPGPRRATTAALLTITGTAWKWRPIADRD